MALPRDSAFIDETQKSVVDLNSIIFGSLALLSLGMFFYLGRFRASKKQFDREDRIDWSTRRFSLWKIFFISLVLGITVALLTRFF